MNQVWLSDPETLHPHWVHCGKHDADEASYPQDDRLREEPPVCAPKSVVLLSDVLMNNAASTCCGAETRSALVFEPQLLMYDCHFLSLCAAWRLFAGSF
ncbi:hypothetical protein EYF80_049941 [Liparis tanakae]|uniref:Uncharacterized protein n=1 Tax=Liparis tanakae TaxID=230148 RepID=A0A4Z2FFF6_9TELE|nr:hypothetical protein EYF80_049941 [Liparis tanakae]